MPPDGSMLEPFNRETWLQRWDAWREYIKNGGSGSWARDAFESLLDYVEELETTRLRVMPDKYIKCIQPERYKALKEAWKHWQAMSVHDHAKHILIHGCTPGIDDEILLERIKELECESFGTT